MCVSELSSSHIDSAARWIRLQCTDSAAEGNPYRRPQVPGEGQEGGLLSSVMTRGPAVSALQSLCAWTQSNINQNSQQSFAAHSSIAKVVRVIGQEHRILAVLRESSGCCSRGGARRGAGGGTGTTFEAQGIDYTGASWLHGSLTIHRFNRLLTDETDRAAPPGGGPVPLLSLLPSAVVLLRRASRVLKP